MEAVVGGYLGRMRALADELLVIAAAALGLDARLLHPAHRRTPPTR